MNGIGRGAIDIIISGVCYVLITEINFVEIFFRSKIRGMTRDVNLYSYLWYACVVLTCVYRGKITMYICTPIVRTLFDFCYCCTNT